VGFLGQGLVHQVNGKKKRLETYGQLGNTLDTGKDHAESIYDFNEWGMTTLGFQENQKKKRGGLFGRKIL